MSYYAFNIYNVRQILNTPGASKNEIYWYLEKIKEYDKKILRSKYNLKQLKENAIKKYLLTDNPIPNEWKHSMDFNSLLEKISKESGYKSLILNYSDNIAFKSKLKEDITLKRIKHLNTEERADASILNQKLKLFKIDKIKKEKYEEEKLNNPLLKDINYCKEIESDDEPEIDKSSVSKVKEDENINVNPFELIPNQILKSDKIKFIPRKSIRKVDVISDKYRHLNTEHLNSKFPIESIQSKYKEVKINKSEEFIKRANKIKSEFIQAKEKSNNAKMKNRKIYSLKHPKPKELFNE